MALPAASAPTSPLGPGSAAGGTTEPTSPEGSECASENQIHGAYTI